MSIPHEQLLIIAIVLLVIGAILFYTFNIPIGPIGLGTLILILGAIAFVIWFVLMLITAIKHA